MLPYENSVDADKLRQCMESGDVAKMRKMLNEVCRERRLDIYEYKQLLLDAEQTGKIPMIKLLLEYDPRYTKEYQNKTLSVLWIAVLYGHRNSAELLVRSGSVDLNEPLGLEFREIYDSKSSVLHVLIQTWNPCWNERFIALAVDHGADLETRDSRGRTPLHYAVWKDQVKMTEWLLEKGADVNAKDNQGETPLLMVVRYSRIANELLPLLARHGADVTIKNARGYNVLYNLTDTPGEHVDLARVLIENGALLSGAYQALYNAIYYEKYKLAELYLNHGADLNERDSSGQTILHYAVSKGNVQMTKWVLEKGADVNIAENNGETPVLAAAQSYKADILLPFVIEHGANVNARDSSGRNALYLLSYAHLQPEIKRVNLARLLIKEGLSPYDKLLLHQPIHAAILLNRNELVNFYLDHGVDVNSATTDGHSLLHLATVLEDPRMLKTLLERGASIDLKTCKGRTALHHACEKSRLKNVSMLLSVGADMLIEDKAGNTPFALIEDKIIKNPCISLMLQKVALKKACQTSIELKDEKIIEKHPELQGYYKDCFKDIAKMKSMKLTDTETVLDLLAKSHREISELIRNREFGANLKLHNLDVLSIYNAKHILRAFERAESHHRSWVEQQDVINEAVFYVLPDLVVRGVLRYMFYDCCRSAE